MKNLLSISLICTIINVGFASEFVTDWKIPIHNDHVPLEVQLAFVKANENATSATWFPYPYGAKQMVSINGLYAPVTIDDVPDYFEVEYTENGKTLRTIYNNKGESKMLITVQSPANAPQVLLDVFQEPNYTEWEILGYETVKFTSENSKMMHKFFLTDAENVHVFYFDKEFEMQKHINWEFYTSEETEKLDTAITTSNEEIKEKIILEDLTWEITFESKDNSFKKGQVKELSQMEFFYLHEEDNVLKFYELSHEPIPHLSGDYKKNMGKIELVDINSVPSAVKKEFLGNKYETWLFDENVEKIELQNGTYDYRLHSKEIKTNHVIIIHTF